MLRRTMLRKLQYRGESPNEQGDKIIELKDARKLVKEVEDSWYKVAIGRVVIGILAVSGPRIFALRLLMQNESL